MVFSGHAKSILEVGLLNGAATSENSMAVSQKNIEHLPCHPIVPPLVYTQEN